MARAFIIFAHGFCLSLPVRRQYHLDICHWNGAFMVNRHMWHMCLNLYIPLQLLYAFNNLLWQYTVVGRVTVVRACPPGYPTFITRIRKWVLGSLSEIEALQICAPFDPVMSTITQWNPLHLGSLWLLILIQFAAISVQVVQHSMAPLCHWVASIIKWLRVDPGCQNTR